MDNGPAQKVDFAKKMQKSEERLHNVLLVIGCSC